MNWNFFNMTAIWLFLALGVVQPLFAQQIHFELPQHSGKEAVLLGFNGVYKDTLQKISLDKNGKGRFDLQKIKEKPGVVELVIHSPSPPDVTFQFLYAPQESPVISSNAFYLNKNEVKITQSVENATVDQWFETGFLLKQKKALILELLKFYPPNDAFYAELSGESAQIDQQLQRFSDNLRQSPLYAATLLGFREDLEQKLGTIWASNEKRNEARIYFQSIDFEKLYQTGLWFEVINPCVEAYIKGSDNYEQFGEDVVANLKRTAYLPAYTALADAAVSICEQFAWWTDEKAVAAFLVTDQRLQKPTGRLIKAMQIQQVSEGRKGPDLVITQQQPFPEIRLMPSERLSEQYTLLVFHETGCGNCENLLEQLKGNYTDLKKKGLRVISFAADRSAADFAKTADALPWEDKFCDFKGFEGVNFKNYAVLGTPTLYVLDANGVIRTKAATLEAVLDLTN